MSLEIIHLNEKGVDIIQLQGDVRPDTIEPFQKAVNQILPGCHRLVIEIPENRDFTTIGITLLTEILSDLDKKKGRLVLVCEDKFHIENLEICNIVPRFCQVFPNRQEALAFFQKE
ncbi:hypothetical protein KJ966_20650 [bacterium]|nr:hypothetical protein [bacterium]